MSPKGLYLKPPNHNLAHQSLRARNSKGPKISIDLKTKVMASGNHQSPVVTLKIKESFDPAQWTQVCRIQDWFKYGIIYHYAPFFLSNPMVMDSGLHYVISEKVPKFITPFLRKTSVIQYFNPW
ncbi:hypothetical protein O181_008283 [Austropuccinia psidii MF-1]|uniref:Uncharacterized protein n=1 Tax=Austropuccinia psidii MF-1 TaxID=1389203 RepID=A0A9Q3BP33_9BASI|nr:hypothetical protein [Austropuccinia psidii MF-1]